MSGSMMASSPCRRLVCVGLALALWAAMPHAVAETIELTRYLLRSDLAPPSAEEVAFPARPGSAVLTLEGIAPTDARVTLNGAPIAAGDIELQAENRIRVELADTAAGRVRITQRTEVELDVLSRIHFNTNVRDFAASRAFYGALGFDTMSEFPDANTVAMAQAIGITEPTTYDGARGGEPGGYLLHGELISLGFGTGVIDLIEFTIPRNEAPPYSALNRLGMSRAVFETADLDADYRALGARGVRFLSAPVVRADGVRFVIMTDPDGTFYELRQIPDAAPGDVADDAPTALQRIGAVVINVSDYQRSLAWYRMLGFLWTADLAATESTAVAAAMGFDAPFTIRGAMLTHVADGSQIELVEWLAPFDPTPPYPIPINHIGIHRMAFTSGDIETDTAALVAEGVPMISPITPCCSGPDASGGIVAFYDPDGTIMELAEMPLMTWLQRVMNLFN
ncbi:MAG: VOC family protein [Gammaproteobacteria bacterium]